MDGFHPDALGDRNRRCSHDTPRKGHSATIEFRACTAHKKGAGAVSGAAAGTLSASRALLSGAEPCAVAGSLAVSASLRAIGVVGPFAVPEAAGGAARSVAAVAKPCSERQPAQLMRLLLQGIVSGLVTPATLRDRGCNPV